jgi:hypothetical protein
MNRDLCVFHPLGSPEEVVEEGQREQNIIFRTLLLGVTSQHPPFVASVPFLRA